VQRIVALHHAERAQRTAIANSRKGNLRGACEVLRAVARRIADYAAGDPELEALANLRSAERDLEAQGYEPLMVNEAYFAAQMRSRGQRDLRQPLDIRSSFRVTFKWLGC
jgi:hypothetical protein